MMLEPIERAPMLVVISRRGDQWRVAFYRRHDGRTWPLFSLEGAWSDVATELEALTPAEHHTFSASDTSGA